MNTVKDFVALMKKELAPTACSMLQEYYAEYCKGGDLQIEEKSDKSPASIADKKTELALREKILKAFPDHGIWGEEFGVHRPDSEYVWVLDPLDGTKEFLKKEEGNFGTLVGVLQKGKPVAGMILEPISSRFIPSNYEPQPINGVENLAEAKIACTNPEIMLDPKFHDILKSKSSKIITGLNCMGFVKILTGEIDIFIESQLKLHDIVGALPVLLNYGINIVDFEGKSYADRSFNLSTARTDKYSVMAAASKNLLDEVMSLSRKNYVNQYS